MSCGYLKPKLSSSLINEYRQVLLKVERLDDFNVTDKDIDAFGDGEVLRPVFKCFIEWLI